MGWPYRLRPSCGDGRFAEPLSVSGVRVRCTRDDRRGEARLRWTMWFAAGRVLCRCVHHTGRPGQRITEENSCTEIQWQSQEFSSTANTERLDSKCASVWLGVKTSNWSACPSNNARA